MQKIHPPNMTEQTSQHTLTTLSQMRHRHVSHVVAGSFLQQALVVIFQAVGAADELPSIRAPKALTERGALASSRQSVNGGLTHGTVQALYRDAWVHLPCRILSHCSMSFMQKCLTLRPQSLKVKLVLTLFFLN